MSNPYLTGNYAPVSEEKTLVELEVAGTIPTHLEGRYVRNGPNPIGDPVGDAVLRHDLDAGTITRRRLGTHAQAGEFVFVPSSSDAAEHDGVLMGFVYDADRDRSRLTLLDAASLDTVAEVLLPARVPHGFHGNWLPT
ncbi:carotenoid oxygenase family protein [Amycolatopsis suaedae]|uniref:Dioxygenase n=1 Tax=Amycolatopsis suaedae TaxID=2510978 RepID=A0A4Q7J4T8_9PSEU|nr:hypothetical protein EWH70_26605 [Amycolatopsis suaedae]